MRRFADRPSVAFKSLDPEEIQSDFDGLFRSLADRAPLMLWTSDLHSNWTFFNRGWLEFTGRALDDELGRGWLDGVHPDDRAACLDRIQNAVLARRPFAIEFRLLGADRQYHWVLGHGSPRAASAGATIYVGSCAETSGRKVQQAHLRESQEQLRKLAARVEAAREEERASLARELHDELGQTLTAIKLDLGRAIGAVSTDRMTSQAVDRLQSLVGLVEIGLQTVKRLTMHLRPPALDHLGLAEAIQWEAMAFQARSGLRCHVRADEESSTLNSEQKTVLFRIFQEALTNVTRHARASAVSVTLAERRKQFELLIRDNGRGVTAEEVNDPRAIGLLGMRERAALVGATFEITGRRGKGTTILVRVPIKPPSTQRQAVRRRRRTTRQIAS
jgi:two-component system, NarL family, sensor histidine kinase UhpB